ncbi:MerR family transcriptional regulator [Streptacidiphilus jiangxiensis]|uniref:DNA-binding transcriptional regulator, MerR family n=1 Tax=Streptacidiphilus jiangxiensis TaxID=235985 RepID=A0A1H7WC98_STRJI|nr:MerR family transcriptional regulator [Streptacidiphilus jiangxiensis]SEM19133.1 DNA-binding transcriptional regulator, MerR family [Streptacidiphilus jiangxiensis]
MHTGMTVGEFSRATHLSIKTLRHYHDVGLLAPADVDQGTGYRYYSPDQVPTAQVIVRLRDLDMPVADVKAVLSAEDVGTRNELIAAHLARLEDRLAQAQSAVESLRDLLARPARGSHIEYRTVREQAAIGIREVVDRQDLAGWWQGALGELRGFTTARRLRPTGPMGGLFATGLVEDERGEALVFVPVDGAVRPVGRIGAVVVPGAELAVAVHRGTLQTIDLTYGDLGTHAARHEIGVDGPLREFYLRGPLDVTEDELVTEVGWPIFRANG